MGHRDIIQISRSPRGFVDSQLRTGSLLSHRPYRSTTRRRPGPHTARESNHAGALRVRRAFSLRECADPSGGGGNDLDRLRQGVLKEMLAFERLIASDQPAPAARLGQERVRLVQAVNAYIALLGQLLQC